MTSPARKGKVYLVGAGPGDPGLLTLRGRDLLQQADVVIYDHLVLEGCLAHVNPSARRIYVGKIAGKHTKTQDQINELLVTEARAGNGVVRLKGGDPFVFGRGGEECLYLQEHGVAFEVVPGVSALAAVPACAGIPLTFRNVATHFIVVTGHEQDSKTVPDVDWKAVSRLGGTLVIFMGVLRIRWITEELLRGGLSPETPAAVIRWGTVPEQQVLAGTLATIAGEVERVKLHPPGLIVIGEVVRLRDRLNGFDPGGISQSSEL